MKCSLLQESQPNHLRNLQDQLLVIRKHIPADQFYDLHQAALLVQDRHQTVPVINEFRRYMIRIPTA